MLRLSFVVVSLLVASSVSAQTVASAFTIPPQLLADFPEAIGGPPVGVTSQPIEADANPTTEEWLLHFPAFRSWYRVVSVQPTGVCAGRWFRPNPFATDYSTTILTRQNGRDVFVVNNDYRLRWPLFSETFITVSAVYVVALDVPACR